MKQQPWRASSLMLATLVSALAGSLAGCAAPARQLHTEAGLNAASLGHWSGRLALQVQDAQQQSFSAGFELLGRAEQGTLLLLSPLGSVMARLQWNERGATLQQGSSITESESLSELIQRMSGSDIPVAALFDWLQGRNTPVEGWEANLSGLEQGRLQAQRFSPTPPASLRIVLDQDPR